MSQESQHSYLSASELLDTNHKVVRETAHQLTAGYDDDVGRLGSIYRFCRDMPYDILNSFRYLAAGKRRASDVLMEGHAFCMGKSSAFVSLCRSSGIPARIAFQQLYCPDKIFMSAEVRELWGDRPLPWHSLGEAFVNNRWLKLDATIPVDVAQRHGRHYVRDFDGINDIPTVEGPIIKNIGSFADYPADIADWYETMAKQVVAALDSVAIKKRAADDEQLWSGPKAHGLAQVI